MTETTPRFRRLSAAERRCELVAAGIACLAEGGIAAFTFDNICAKSGVTRGLIAHYFGSKEGLLIAVMTSAFQRTIDDLRTMESDTTFTQLFTWAFERATVDNLRVWLALWGEVAINPAISEEHRKLYDTYRSLIAGVIRGINPSVDAEGVAELVIAAIRGIWLQLALDPERLSAECARAQAETMLRALLA